MKILTVWILFLVVIQTDCVGSKLSRYIATTESVSPSHIVYHKTSFYDTLGILSKSIEIIKSSKEFELLSQEKRDSYIISCRQISSVVYDLFFRKEIKKYTGVEESILKKNAPTDHLKKKSIFKKLNKKKRGEILISFSETSNKIFFVEVASLRKKGNCNTPRPTLGEFYVYMFYIKNDVEVELVRTLRLD